MLDSVCQYHDIMPVYRYYIEWMTSYLVWPTISSKHSKYIGSHLLQLQMRMTTPFLCSSEQGIIDMKRNGNFCEGTWVSKVIAETKVDVGVEQ